MNANPHLDEQILEQYSLRTASEADVERVEEHLLVCAECRSRLEASDDYVQAMRGAAKEFRETPAPRRFSWPQLLLPIAAAVIVIAVLLPRYTFRQLPPVAVSLSAMRGPAGEAKAPAGRRLNLQPDVQGLSAAPYRLEVVDQTGSVVTAGAFPLPPIGPLHPGTYFVRVYSRTGDLLREFGLQTAE